VQDVPDDVAAQAAPAKRAWLRSPLFWLLAGLPPLGAVVGSWYLGGDETWLKVTCVAFCVLLLVGLGMLRGAFEARGRGMIWIAALFGYLLLVWGAWTGVGYFLPVTAVKVKPNKDGPDGPTRIVYRGEVVGELGRTDDHSFEIRGRFDPSRLRVETFGPEGWVQCPCRDFVSSVEVEAIPTVGLYVDNRQRGQTRLECGELKLQVPAGAAFRRVIPAPAGSLPLLLDGEVVGSLEGEHLLIDVLGTREYRLREVTYRGGVLHLFQPERPDRLPLVEYFRGRRLHRLPRQVDHFLEPAPEKVNVTTYGWQMDVRAERYELLDAD
jgi:hypothetical protein